MTQRMMHRFLVLYLLFAASVWSFGFWVMWVHR